MYFVYILHININVNIEIIEYYAVSLMTREHLSDIRS